MKTRALFGRKGVDIQARELELSLRPDSVLVRVRACGVCGTDLNFVRDWEGDYQPLGHEISAEVVEVGSLVNGFKAGDTVTVEDCSLCGECPDCKAGRSDLCRNMHTLEGVPGMGEYLVVRAGNLNRYEGLDHISACLTEPLAVALSAVDNAAIPMGGSVVVLGNGPIGLLAARVARLRGAGYVAVTGRSRSRAMGRARFAVAEKLDIDAAVCTQEEDLEEVVRKHCPKGVDRVIVTSPPQSVPEGLRLLRFGGTIVLLGLDFGGKNIIPFDVNAAIFNKTTVKTTFAEPAVNFPLATELIRQGRVDAALFQTHTFSFADAKAHFTHSLQGDIPLVKGVFVP